LRTALAIVVPGVAGIPEVELGIAVPIAIAVSVAISIPIAVPIAVPIAITVPIAVPVAISAVARRRARRLTTIVLAAGGQHAQQSNRYDTSGSQHGAIVPGNPSSVVCVLEPARSRDVSGISARGVQPVGLVCPSVLLVATCASLGTFGGGGDGDGNSASERYQVYSCL
jgi:hypothetical protein